MRNSGNTLANMFRAGSGDTDNVALACLVSFSIDLGASAAALATYTSLKPAYQKVEGLLRPPLDSNHLLLQMVHETKWRSVCVVIEEFVKDPSNTHTFANEHLKNCFSTADFFSKSRISRFVDPRDETVEKPPTIAQKVITWALGGLSAKAPDLKEYSEADRTLVRGLEETLVREKQNQPHKDGAATNELYAVTSKMAANQLLSELGNVRYGMGLREKSQKVGGVLNDLIERFDDPTLGWAATYRCLLKDRLSNAENQNEFNRILLNFASEGLGIQKESLAVGKLCQRLIEGLSDTVIARLDNVDDRLLAIENGLKPQRLKLHPTGGDVRSYGAVRFSDFVYSSQQTEFAGRSVELNELDNFLYADDLVSWWQIAGDSGQGKSRLGLELVEAAMKEGWHAGFLQKGELSKIDWNSFSLDRPTLCVVDYIASPVKATEVANGLVSLIKRSDPDFRDWDRPLVQPFRLLLLERSPFASPESTMPALWYSRFCETGEQIKIAERQHKAFPIMLSDIGEPAMRYIAKTWRSNRGLTLPSEAQLDRVITQLRRTSPSTKKMRAWRPLIAMAMIDFIMDADAETDTGTELPDVLDFILREEKQLNWVDENNQLIDPRIEAKRLAVLATIVGELDVKSSDIDRGFFGHDEIAVRDQAWMVIGYRTRSADTRRAKKLPLIAREPDLLGEFMIDWLDLTDSDLSNIITEAWRINALATYEFLIRLSEDHKDLDLTTTFTTLAGKKPPELPVAISEVLDINAASFFGLFGLARNLLSSGQNPNSLHSNGAFPLLFAAQNGHADVVTALLAVPGINVNQEDAKTGTFPLLMAAQNGHADVVTALLAVPGINVNQENVETGTFPLLMAAQEGHTDVVTALLAVPGINVNQENVETGTFPLIMAAQEGHTDVVTALLAVPGISVNQENAKTGTFPLLFAAQNGHADVVTALLAVPGISVNQEDAKTGTFPLIMAAQNGHADVVTALLAVPGINVNQEDAKTGTFPLLMAAQNGHADVVTALLAVPGINVNQENVETGTFPLLMAAQEGHTDVVTALLAVPGINVNQENVETGTFPLIMAAQEGHADVVTALLDAKGIEVNKAHETGTFPLLMAAQNGHADVVTALLAVPGINVNQENVETGTFPLLFAAQEGHTDVVTALLAVPGINVNQEDAKTGTFPLIMAAQEGHADVVTTLLDAKGIEVNKAHETGTFPLLMAAQNGHADVVTALLAMPGINVNQENVETGTFPLLMAAQEGHTDVVTALLAVPGINVNQENAKTGTFPLLMASGKGHVENIGLLVDRGADIQKIWVEAGVNSLELCLGLLREESQDEVADVSYQAWNGATKLLELGATLQDGRVPERPPKPN